MTARARFPIDALVTSNISAQAVLIVQADSYPGRWPLSWKRIRISNYVVDLDVLQDGQLPLADPPLVHE